MNRAILAWKGNVVIALAELPKVAPLESAQIRFAGSRPVLPKQLHGASVIARVQFRPAPFLFSLLPQLRFQLLGNVGAVFGPSRPHRLPGANASAHQQRSSNSDPRRKSGAMAPEQFSESIDIAWGPGQYRLAVEITVDLQSQSVGR